MLMCSILLHLTHMRPRVRRAPGLPCALCIWRANEMQNFGQVMPREHERMSHNVIARSEATRQSSYPLRREMDCFASLAMTWIGCGAWVPAPVRNCALGR